MPRFAPSRPLSDPQLVDASADASPRRRHSRREATPEALANPLTQLVFPSWARADEKSPGAADPQKFAAEAFFAAGAGLALLDRVFRENPPFAGALRQRLALRAAGASAKILRLREDEGDLRDTEHLGLAGADPGRAGRLHRLWRALSLRPARLDGEVFARVLLLLDAPPTLDAKSLGASVGEAIAKDRPPLLAAALAAARVAEALPPEMRAEAEVLALWAADCALAKSLGWERPVALLATRILAPSLRRGASGKRPRPGDRQWPEILAAAAALAACDAHALAIELARRSERLLAAAPKLRAKGAARVIELLLADDAVSPARAAKTTALSDRAARRLFDRLLELGAVRELSGRPSFRLYGL
ncbi:DUF1403 family protein [Rhodoblastus acidophilus]|uniref:DUF1403 family protein n=1 Tax=Candidatus Rhodoblastus alkanivorans TaxID=2954117 RepID=UPI001FAB2940|nr:DUF1403 family protein [Candidatus Rhodoblastus alkanivorans]MCI4679033.1 DUF1403 family protein [Candidatus Rhodoblastus alkanivorans]MDI4642760.1 DUF1403 family protein [Rhodoblastus acidophilus]